MVLKMMKFPDHRGASVGSLKSTSSSDLAGLTEIFFLGTFMATYFECFACGK